MLSSRNIPKTIILRSPDSDKVREVIVTSVLLPKSENEINRTATKYFGNSEDFALNVGVVMEKRVCKRRLDHLSIEEKILRKKLKNREAAQTSRDRKKARLEELEASVVQLQNENEVLHEEVRSLKDDKESLLRENARLTEEVWRLSVVGGGDGPAAGSQSAPSTPTHPPPQPPLSPAALPPCHDPLALDDWDWLDQVPITPVVEELEQLASSLFAEAHRSQEAESSEESLVGSPTKSLEPCWPCLAGEAKSSTTTTIKAKVTNSEKTSISQKKRIPLTLEKLDLQKAQSSNGQSLETPVVSVEMSPLENTQSSAVNKIKVCTPNDKSKELQTKQESVNSDKDQHPLPPENLDLMHVGEEVIFSGDEMDCVVMEEVVETTEYLGSPSPCTVPSVVVTEVVNDTVTDDIVEFSEDLLMPPDVMEETSSDHGYESYDSPISEPDHLVNLFPELEFW